MNYLEPYDLTNVHLTKLLMISIIKRHLAYESLYAVAEGEEEGRGPIQLNVGGIVNFHIRKCPDRNFRSHLHVEVQSKEGNATWRLEIDDFDND